MVAVKSLPTLLPYTTISILVRIIGCPGSRTLPATPGIWYNGRMTQTVEAIYSHGVLEPLEPLDLSEQQRVRLTIEPLKVAPPAEPQSDRHQAMQELMDALKNSTFSHGGPYPTRDELHER